MEFEQAENVGEEFEIVRASRARVGDTVADG